jgi:hypothetical protein
MTREVRTRISVRRRLGGSLALLSLLFVCVARAQPHDPLSSWNDGASKQAIVTFVGAAVQRGNAGFIAPADRVAVFDNDGTLWAEQPIYFQFAFALDRVKALVPQHPEWKTTQPFKAVLDGDMKTVAGSGEKGLVEIMMAAHAGMTTDEFATIVSDWSRKARHPRFKTPFTDLMYQPMAEFLAYPQLSCCRR